MNSDANENQLDLKIARDRIMAEGVESLWARLCEAIKTTCQKLNDNYTEGLTYQIEADSVIRIVAPSRPTPQQFGNFNPTLEIKIDRAQNKIVSKLVHNSRSAETHLLRADLATKTVTIGGQSPIGFAERQIVERLLEQSLA